MKFINPQTGAEQNAETFDLGEAELPGLPFVGLTGTPDGIISQIPNDTAHKPEGEAVDMDPSNDLAFIRHSFPFVAIMPTPHKVITVTLDGTGNQSAKLPSETTIAKFIGVGDWYMSFGSNANVPTNAAGGSVTDDTGLYKPSDFFYMRGVSHVSFNADAPCTVQVMCWNTNKWPEKGRV
jgi:hypothetical protein